MARDPRTVGVPLYKGMSWHSFGSGSSMSLCSVRSRRWLPSRFCIRELR